jgi:hypothetical protein
VGGDECARYRSLRKLRPISETWERGKPATMLACVRWLQICREHDAESGRRGTRPGAPRRLKLYVDEDLLPRVIELLRKGGPYAIGMKSAKPAVDRVIHNGPIWTAPLGALAGEEPGSTRSTTSNVNWPAPTAVTTRRPRS